MILEVPSTPGHSMTLKLALSALTKHSGLPALLFGMATSYVHPGASVCFQSAISCMFLVSNNSKKKNLLHAMLPQNSTNRTAQCYFRLYFADECMQNLVLTTRSFCTNTK